MANKNKYRKEEAFIIAHAQGISSRELADLVNREYGTAYTTEEMQNFKKARKIKSGFRGSCNPVFAKEVEEYIKSHYIGVGWKEQIENVRREFGIEYTTNQMKRFYATHRLNSGVTGHFEPGNVPANKGKKAKTVGRMAENQFRAGNRPHNAVPVGTIVTRSDGYMQKKIAEPNVWRLLHILTWEENYGKVPEGMLVEFKDMNRQNTDINNLFLATRREHVEMNRQNSALRSHVPELTQAGHTVAKLRIAAEERRKGKRKEAAGRQQTGKRSGQLRRKKVSHGK